MSTLDREALRVVTGFMAQSDRCGGGSERAVRGQSDFARVSRVADRRKHSFRDPVILAALDAAESPGDMDIAGWRLHSLKGTRKAQWSVWVSGNWQVTFRFDGTNATDVNYEDYH